MREINIGTQGFEEIRVNNDFYIDKSSFIKEWWENRDTVTLITRPRRFGKTLNMDMLNCFFSHQYAGRSDLFEGLDIWKDEKYHALQGTYPVIALSFADIKSETFSDARIAIIETLRDTFEVYKNLWEDDSSEEKEKYSFMDISSVSPDAVIAKSLRRLSYYLSQRYGKKILILLDEYDTPMQEAYINGYWDEMAGFMRSLFNSTFKTNPSMERGLMTGITRISKESIFSDLNNLEVVTTTSGKYEMAFGFTEKEVFNALDEYNLSDRKEQVKAWYDGFTFGDVPDIYNPWSIVKFLDSGGIFAPYWANTSSNSLISYELRASQGDVKNRMESLMNGGTIIERLDEEIIYSQLDTMPDAIWSFFLASGYLKVVQKEFDGRRFWYTLSLTNLEVELMFENLIDGWFRSSESSNDAFIEAMIAGDTESMNDYMNDIALATFSSFDTGKKPSITRPPENFYHGFVLGLLVRERARYTVRSNRESGYGRYDVCLIPKKNNLPGIVIEFKVQRVEKGEETLNDTAENALKQIAEKQYAAELRAEGVEDILEYGFAFEGKKVLIRKAGEGAL